MLLFAPDCATGSHNHQIFVIERSKRAEYAKMCLNGLRIATTSQNTRLATTRTFLAILLSSKARSVLGGPFLLCKTPLFLLRSLSNTGNAIPRLPGPISARIHQKNERRFTLGVLKLSATSSSTSSSNSRSSARLRFIMPILEQSRLERTTPD